jgi:hypothetical protein
MMRIARILALALALAVIVSTVSHFIADRYANRAVTVSQQLAILERQPFVDINGQVGDVPEFRNRILVPALVKLVIAAGRQQPVTAYFAVRVLCAFTMFAFVGWYAATAASPRAVLPLLSVLALILVASFNHPLEFPSDYLDVLFTTTFVYAARSRRVVVAIAAVVIGVTARESAAFAGVIWWFCASGPRARRALVGAALVVVAMAATTALRYEFHVAGGSVFNSIAVQGSLQSVGRSLFTNPAPQLWSLGLIAIAVLLWHWLDLARSWAPIDRAALRAAAVVLAITLVFGVIHELRIYMPVVTCVLLAGVPRGVESQKS